VPEVKKVTDYTIGEQRKEWFKYNKSLLAFPKTVSDGANVTLCGEVCYQSH